VLDAHTGDPVPGLRLVTGARTPLPGGAQPPLGFAGGERPRRLPGAVLDLAQRPAPAFEAVRAWLGHRYALRRADQDRIVERASGHRGYADLAARLVSAGVALPDRAGDLDALYAHELARLAGVHRILPSMLAVLARVRGEGFAPARLASLLGVPLADVTAAAAAARHLLRGRTGLRLYHRCLAEHLAMHGTDPAAVDWRIAQYLCMQVDGRRPPDPYALRHLPVHLADAAWGLVRQDSAPRRMIGVDRGGAARRLLDELIADPTFLIRAVSTVGAEAVHTALSYVEVRSDAVAPDTACVTRMLRGQLPVLGEARAVDPAWTAQQLCYEAAGAGAYLLMTGLAAQVVGIQTQWATGIPGSGERLAGQRITHVAITAGGGYGVSTDARGVVRSWRLDAGPVPYMAAGAGTIVDGPGSLEWAPRRATWRFHNASAWHGRSRYWVKPHAGYARRAVAAAADRVGSAAFALAPGAGVFLVGDARGLTVYHLGGARHGQVAGRLRVHHGVSAVAVNPVDHDLALLGTPSGQLVYVRLALGR
ncbi:MAG TPA: hypothetical protein VJT31_38205, partial [Rugosimonospora sp.]|nr:hypothetical protein [Rugosimonospora sp.]